MAKKLNPEDLMVAFQELSDKEQVSTFATLKIYMDEKEKQMKEHIEAYNKVNGCK